jgi:LPXTG-motif cell wall-anchored protein
MNQPLLDENIVIYSTYLEESDKKFRIVLENDRNSFDETFYIHDKSIIKTYKGYSHYTSEQQGTIYQEPEPTVEPMAEPEPTVELIVEPIVEPTPEPGPIVEPTPEPEPIVELEPTPVSEPEPEQLPETDTSMWYWFVIAGILGIIFVIVYKQRHKKCKECGVKLTQSEIDDGNKTCNKCRFDSKE